MQVAEEFDVGNITGTLYFDPEPTSPREGDNLGTMVCWHSRYNLGDKHDHANPTDFRLSLLPDAVLDRLEAKELDGVEAKVRAYIAQVLAGIVKDSDLESRVLELEERFSKEAPHVRQ